MNIPNVTYCRYLGITIFTSFINGLTLLDVNCSVFIYCCFSLVLVLSCASTISSVIIRLDRENVRTKYCFRASIDLFFEQSFISFLVFSTTFQYCLLFLVLPGMFSVVCRLLTRVLNAKRQACLYLDLYVYICTHLPSLGLPQSSSHTLSYMTLRLCLISFQ